MAANCFCSASGAGPLGTASLGKWRPGLLARHGSRVDRHGDCGSLRHSASLRVVVAAARSGSGTSKSICQAKAPGQPVAAPVSSVGGCFQGAERVAPAFKGFGAEEQPSGTGVESSASPPTTTPRGRAICLSRRRRSGRGAGSDWGPDRTEGPNEAKTAVGRTWAPS